MSADVVSLRLQRLRPSPRRSPDELWFDLWELAWQGLELHRSPATDALRALYCDELLPDHEASVKLVAVREREVELCYLFSDFGGSLSRASALLADWFALAIAAHPAAIDEAISGGFDYARTTIPTIEAALARPAPTLMFARGELWFVERDGASLTLARDDRAIAQPTDDEHTAALALLSLGETHDPVRARLASQRSSLDAERAKVEARAATQRRERIEHALVFDRFGSVSPDEAAEALATDPALRDRLRETLRQAMADPCAAQSALFSAATQARAERRALLVALLDEHACPETARRLFVEFDPSAARAARWLELALLSDRSSQSYDEPLRRTLALDPAAIERLSPLARYRLGGEHEAVLPQIEALGSSAVDRARLVAWWVRDWCAAVRTLKLHAPRQVMLANETAEWLAAACRAHLADVPGDEGLARAAVEADELSATL